MNTAADSLSGSGKSYVLAAIADRITRAADPDKALLYVTCSASASGAGLDNSQSYTAESICRTFLSQLYDYAVQGEDHVGLLEACNGVFKKARAKNNALPSHMRDDNTGLPEFAHGFSQIAALLKKDVVLVLDGLARSTLDDKDQGELLRKLRALMAAVPATAGTRLHILASCGSSSKFFNDLELPLGSYIDVGEGNSQDIELVITSELKSIPGLSPAEREEAKAAILDKARSRFLYVRDTAIPFMREPFQRPLSKRLEALPDDTSDRYSKVLSKMSPNYLELLRTALTWSLLSPDFPGFPTAREIMDSFQGTYDVPPEPGAENEADVEPGFPPTSRLEIEQLREAIDPFLALSQNQNGPIRVYRPDPQGVADFFMSPAAEAHEEHDGGGEQPLCARCGSTRSASKAITISPKEGHLQMALTCLRHLNHPLFQKRAGLVPKEMETSEHGTDEEIDSQEVDEDAVQEADEEGDDEEGDDEGDDEADSEAPPQVDGEDANNAEQDDFEKQVQAGYETEESVDDEDVIQPRIYDLSLDDIVYGFDGEQKDGDDDDNEPARVRYEVQYWPWHILEAEKLWTPEERATNGDWAALMQELDKFAFETPGVFAAWQAEYPDKEAGETHFSLVKGPHKPLHVAAYLGLTSWARHLLARGEELNGLSGGYSPLQAAACRVDRLEMMKLLLQNGADVNAENEAGCSAFHYWLLRGDKGIEGVRMLLDHGADPRTPCSREHFSALHYFATRGEDPAVLDLLLAHGADINAVDPKERMQFPPLHVLLLRREVPPALLEAFIRHNADTNSENAMSARPLQIICTHGQVENLKILLRSEVLEVDDPDLHGTTAVHEAAFFGHDKCVRVLLEHGADPDITDKLDRAALHSAGRRGNTECVRTLLEYTRQINLPDKHGWTPFFCACLGKDEESALLILDALIGQNLSLADINKPTRSGRTPLRQAADHGFDRVVSKLIRLAEERNDAANLAINARDTKKGMTALHRAAMGGYTECVRALLAANPPADASIRDAQSRTALSYAYEQWAIATRKSSYEDIVSMLVDADPSAAAADADLVAVCAANGSTRLLEKLWRLNADLNRPDRYGWTPLELARNFARKEAEAFLAQQAAWASLLPTRWATAFPGTTPLGARSVLADGTAIVHASGKRVCVSADKPLPPGLNRYYFEITIAVPDSGSASNDNPHPEVAIGFCTLGGAAIEFPGWPPTSDDPSTARSWGYHSDTGGFYDSADEEAGREGWVDVVYKARQFGPGDTVGCGVDRVRGEVWFTKNGEKMGELKGVSGRLFPVVGLHERVKLETNFGVGKGAVGKGFVWRSGELGLREPGGKDGMVVELVVGEKNQGVNEIHMSNREVVVGVSA